MKRASQYHFYQLESYFDVDEAEFFTTSEDASPNLHAMFKEYSSGYFKVPSVGAGTANTEFEVLTGMNMRYFGPGEYPYKTIVKYQPTESAASALSALGYGTHALHNNGGNFYSRAEVYNQMGFDSFTSKEFMNILQTTENGWAKDDVLIDHILEAMDTTEQQDFVFGVSVQGHGDYPEEQIIENPKIKVEGIKDEATKNKWEYYVNQVYEMDAFAGKLVQKIEERGEPTVVVFYGDHLPTMGLEAEDLKSRYLYNTNYVIWDNIGLEKEDRNIPSYQIVADVLERLDIHSGTVLIIIRNAARQKKITSLTWSCFSMILCTERNMSITAIRLSRKDICRWALKMWNLPILYRSWMKGTVCTDRILQRTAEYMSMGNGSRANF